MAENTKIEWCDATFNPWIGCTKVSPGCDHCYAECSTPSRVQKVQWGPGAPRRRTSPSNWRKPLAWNAAHEEFFAANGRRQRVFCASLADVFDNAVSVQWRYALLRLIMDTPNLDWLLLTKRIGNAEAMLEQAMRALTVGREGWRDNYLPNIWLGATIVNQEEADRDIPKLLCTPARIHFLSMEPLLGPVKLPEVFLKRLHFGGRDYDYPDDAGMIDWVIAGGESGHGARPMHPDWARSLRDQCAAAGVPFLFKQWGEWLPVDPTGAAIPGCGATPGREPAFRFAANHYFTKVGKKAAGRLLDGRTHDEFPRGAA